MTGTTLPRTFPTGPTGPTGRAEPRRRIALVAHDNKKAELLAWARHNRSTLQRHSLLRVAALWNVPVACNVASADLMISSPLLAGDYAPVRPRFGA